MPRFYAGIGARATPPEILNLMTRFRTSWAEPELRIPFLESARERFRGLEEDGIVETEEAGCSVTPLGRTFLRNVCMTLDARLARQTPPDRLFSRAV